jgi:manganese-dependent inorganic pyrophosphatase
MSALYVLGHVNPDTDSIASAVGYAWLLRERDAQETIAARAGPLNPQTTWVLKRLEMDAPALLTDASPRFESVTRRLDTTAPDQPLREAWAIANRTGGVTPVVDQDGAPYGLVTGWSLFSFLSETVGPNPKLLGKSITEVLDFPCKEACDVEVPRFPRDARIRDSLNRILRLEHNDFWVVDKEGKYFGVCRQRDLLNPPRLRLILVDHNESRQAIASLEEAELVEVLDHHRLDNPSTIEPIRFTVDVVGSTSTLVAERIFEAGLSAPPDIAGLLLAGLISDTLALTSPTSTKRDRQTADRLGRWAFASSGPLKGETLETYSQAVLEASAGLLARDPMEIVSTDKKLYEAGGMRFIIAQAEVTDLLQIEDLRQPLHQALDDLRAQNGLDFTMLMVTDVVQTSSRLLISSEAPAILNDLPYARLSDGTLEAKGMVSRKKQLVPVVFSLLEE